MADGAERVIGEISPAYSFARQHGPVRIVISDRRFIVLWTGGHSWLPRLSRYNEWRKSAANSIAWRLGSGALPSQAESIAWSLEHNAISNLFAQRKWGLGADPKVALLNVAVFQYQLGFGASTGVGWGPMPVFTFAVPGQPNALEGFLRSTPLSRRVSRTWYLGKKLDPP